MDCKICEDKKQGCVCLCHKNPLILQGPHYIITEDANDDIRLQVELRERQRYEGIQPGFTYVYNRPKKDIFPET